MTKNVVVFIKEGNNLNIVEFPNLPQDPFKPETRLVIPDCSEYMRRNTVSKYLYLQCKSAVYCIDFDNWSIVKTLQGNYHILHCDIFPD